MINLNDPEIKFAIDTVVQASFLVKTVQDEMVSPALTKDDRSPVTVADYAAQALVGRLLERRFPDDPLIGEEDSASLRTPEGKDILERITSFVRRYVQPAEPEMVCEWIDRGSAKSAPRYWTLDPIDGTKGFLRGNQYAVAFALVYDEQVQIGVLGCPELFLHGTQGILMVGVRGQGSWYTSLEDHANGFPVFSRAEVSRRSDPSQARLLRSFESGHTNVNKIDLLAETVGVRSEPIRMDSQAKYAVLAAGMGEIYLRLLSENRPDYQEKIWDQAAGSIIIEEAGGRVTDLDGKRLDFTQGRTLAENRGICATNGRLHLKTLDVLKAIRA